MNINMTTKKVAAETIEKPVPTVKKPTRVRKMTSSRNKKYEILTSSHCKMIIEEDDRQITLYRVKLLKTIYLVGIIYRAGDIGGWIENESCLSFSDHDNAWVSNDAMVYGGSTVSGNALVRGHACVKNHSNVYGDSLVNGSAIVDRSYVEGKSTVRGQATVRECRILGSVVVEDAVKIVGPIRLSGTAIFRDRSRVAGYCIGDIAYSDELEISAGNFHGDTLISEERGFIVFTNVGSENGTLTVSTGGHNELIVTRGCFTGSIKDFIAASVQNHKDRSVINKEYRALIRVAETRLKPLQKIVDELVAEEQRIALAKLQVRDAS